MRLLSHLHAHRLFLDVSQLLYDLVGDSLNLVGRGTSDWPGYSNPS